MYLQILTTATYRKKYFVQENWESKTMKDNIKQNLIFDNTYNQ